MIILTLCCLEPVVFIHYLCFPVLKYSQHILCDNLSSVRGNGGDRVGRLVVSPVALEPSHTLLESHNAKTVRACDTLPHVMHCTHYYH